MSNGKSYIVFCFADEKLRDWGNRGRWDGCPATLIC